MVKIIPFKSGNGEKGQTTTKNIMLAKRN